MHIFVKIQKDMQKFITLLVFVCKFVHARKVIISLPNQGI